MKAYIWTSPESGGALGYFLEMYHSEALAQNILICLMIWTGDSLVVGDTVLSRWIISQTRSDLPLLHYMEPELLCHRLSCAMSHG